MIETPPLYENLTAYENLRAGTLALYLPESRINKVLEIVQLQNTGKKRAGQFSLGMKQRLGIALALLAQPKLLIPDEPTNGLDTIVLGAGNIMIYGQGIRFAESTLTYLFNLVSVANCEIQIEIIFCIAVTCGIIRLIAF